jgi:tetratricopeptide (TPR) repeat protein
MKASWKSAGLAGALLVLLTLAAYLPALRAGFIWDDNAYVTENPLLTAPDGLARIWFSAHHQSQYFPLVYTTLRWERMLWGLHPAGYHAVNLAMHLLNALLVWAVLRRLGLPGAWLAAAVWAIHPVNVETVAWITELKNTESTLFYLLALLAWLEFTDGRTNRGWPFYASALLAYALALLSKTTACTLPAAMLLVLWVRRRPLRWPRWVEIAPFVVLGVAMGLLSVWWEAHLGNYRDVDSGVALSLGQRLLVAARALWFYAGKLVWPANLSFSYTRWQMSARDPLQVLALVGCLGMAALLWRKRNSHGRVPAAAAAFFVATLSPLLGFIPLYTFRYSFVADHYLYVASGGLIALGVGAGVTLVGRWGPLGRRVGTSAAAALLLLLAALTFRRAHVYRDSETLWRDTVAKNPTGFMPRNNLGMSLAAQGRFAEAIAEHTAALRLKPDDATAHYNLGRALFNVGKLAEAEAAFVAALRIDPNLAEAHNNLGLTLARLGRFAEAIPEHRAALYLKPHNARAHNNLGLALAASGQVAEAVEEYRAALRLMPDYVSARNNLAVALVGQGKLDEAIAEWRAVLRLRPDSPEIHLNWGDALAAQGRSAEAAAEYREALRLRAEWPPALAKLAWSLATAAEGQTADQAVQVAERLCARTGCRQAEALDVLAAAYAAAGRFEDAVRAAEQAVASASAAGQAELAGLVRQRLQLYLARRPYRERGSGAGPALDGR